jgi:hypothetical protein
LFNRKKKPQNYEIDQVKDNITAILNDYVKKIRLLDTNLFGIE